MEGKSADNRNDTLYGDNLQDAVFTNRFTPNSLLFLRQITEFVEILLSLPYKLLGYGRLQA
ncbi:MAG: hypothetical protein BACD_03847 [Bacteroides rodentium]